MVNASKKHTILIVDDMPINIQVLAGFLKSDYHIKIASSGKKAIHVASSDTPPHLILLDIMMPEMDGFEVCRQLKSRPDTRDIPVIFITALANVEDKVKGFAIGGVDYVTKPFQREEVRARARTHLKIESQKRRLRQQAIELNKARESAETAKLAAETANRAKSIFLANMSHEIRTPMNAILGFSEILLEKIKEAQQRKFLSSIHSSGKTLLSLINDILDLSKIEAEKMEIQPEPVNIKTLISEIEMIFYHKIRKRKIELVTSIDPQIPVPMLLDEVRIRQILINLVGNAIKFTKKGYVKVIVDFQSPSFPSLKNKQVHLIIEVEDTGAGISDDQHEQIFEHFHQKDNQPVKEYGGTGLGLTITKKLVELMGGQISLLSEVGVGSRFKVYLPCVRIAEEIEVDETDYEQDLIDVKFEPSTILVVDDAVLNRVLIKGYLEDSGFSIIEAESGEHALYYLNSNNNYDLILMDLKMPGRNGYEVTRIIKDDEKLKHIPVIAFTASAMKEDQEVINSLFDGFLSKPISRAALMHHLKKFLPYKINKNEAR